MAEAAALMLSFSFMALFGQEVLQVRGDAEHVADVSPCRGAFIVFGRWQVVDCVVDASQSAYRPAICREVF